MTGDEIKKHRESVYARIRNGIGEDALQALLEMAASRRQALLLRLEVEEDDIKAAKYRGQCLELRWWMNLRENIQPNAPE